MPTEIREQLAGGVNPGRDAVVAREAQRETDQNESKRGVGMHLGNEPQVADHIGRQHRPAAQRHQAGGDSNQPDAL